MKKVILLIAFAIIVSELYSQYTYNCTFQKGATGDIYNIKASDFDYQLGNEIRLFTHPEYDYVYKFQAEYDDGYLTAELYIYNRNYADEDDFLYFSSTEVSGMPEYFYVDLITPKVAIDCECKRE